MKGKLTGRSIISAGTILVATLVLLLGSLPATRDARASLAPLAGASERLDALTANPKAAAAARSRSGVAFGTSAGLEDIPATLAGAATAAGLQIDSLSTGEPRATGLTINGVHVGASRVTVTLSGARRALPAFLDAVAHADRIMRVEHLKAVGGSTTVELTAFTRIQP